MEYEDFELLIERAGSACRARVLESPAGTGAGPLFDLPEKHQTREVLEALARGRHLTLDPPPEEAVPRGFGRRLFQAVFAGPVRDLWQRSVGKAGSRLRLRLRLEDDPSLLAVPWELLEDPDRGPVAIERPVVRRLEGPFISQPLAGRAPLRMLAVLSCPPDLPFLDVEEEWRLLDRMLGPLVADEQVVIERLVQPTAERLRQVLQAEEWEVLHFVGHGVSGALFLTGLDGTARAAGDQTLSALLQVSSLRLVVLNACEGASPGGSDLFPGVAQALLRRGIPAVVAMQQEVSDAVAISFAEHFYRALSRRLPVDGALLEARRALAGEEEAQWEVPVLYLHAPQGDLVESPPGRSFCPDRRFWISSGAAVLGTLLLCFALGWQIGRPATPVSPEPKSNPPECPSPPGLDMSFVRVKATIFQMGQEKGDKSDEPVHFVSVTKPFCLGAFEVTRKQWSEVMGTPPPENEADLPQSGVTYEAAQDFFMRLNQRENVNWLYRLPTEAEWELAARAETQTIYSFGDDEKDLSHFGNCRGDDGYGELAPVGRFEPNPWGLYDMYGNVFEWVSDWYGPYPAERKEDPEGPKEGKRRIRRGGSWESGARSCTSAARSDVEATGRQKENGVRIVREIR